MKDATRRSGIIFVLLMMVAGLVGAADEQPLSNSDVVKLTKLDMGDEVIITKIKTANAVNFDMSTDELLRLKESGVSRPVIAAMLGRSSSGTVTAPTTSGTATGPTTSTTDSGERPCIAHFVNTGNFAHRKFDTWQEFTGIAYDTVFRKVTQATMNAGYRNITGNASTGTIIAGGGVINIIVKETGKGVIRVEAGMEFDRLRFVAFTEAKSQDLLCKCVEGPLN